MADDKIVTKKTAAKPAAPTKKAPAKAAAPAKAVTKKAVPKPAVSAAPAPAAAKTTAAVSPKPAGAALPPSAAATGQAVSASKAKTGEPPLADPKVPSVPLEEKPVSLHGLAEINPEQRIAMIREAAYYKAEKRGFAVGNDAQDWAEAEREIDELLAKARQIYGG